MAPPKRGPGSTGVVTGGTGTVGVTTGGGGGGAGGGTGTGGAGGGGGGGGGGMGVPSSTEPVRTWPAPRDIST